MRRPLLATLALAALAAAPATPAGAQEAAPDPTADDAVIVLPPPDAPDHNARSRDRRGERDGRREDRDDTDDDRDDDREDADDDVLVVVVPRLPLPLPLPTAPAPRPAPVAPAPRPSPAVPAPLPVEAPPALAAPAAAPPTPTSPAAAPPAAVSPPTPTPVPAEPARPGAAAVSGGTAGAPRLSVPQGPVLQHPERLLPRAGVRLAGRRPVLRWRAQRGATVYNLQVFRLQGMRVTKVLSAFPRRPRHRVAAGVLRRGGVYVWRVWAYDGDAGRFMRAPVGVSTFRVRPRAGSAGT